MTMLTATDWIMNLAAQIARAKPGEIIMLPAHIAYKDVGQMLPDGVAIIYDPNRHAVIVRTDWTLNDPPEPTPEPDPLLPPVDVTRHIRHDSDTPDAWI